MNNKLIFAIGVVIGGAIGVMASKKYFEKKYDAISQKEIDSVKETFSRMEKRDKTSEKEKKAAPTAFAKSSIDNFKAKKIMVEESYVSDESTKDEAKEKPYVIPPEEFGFFEGEGYESISLTYYLDGTLAEGKEIIEDIDGTIGLASLNHFGEYEDDSVFVRNDRLKCDFEILLDQRTYAEAIG